MEPLQKALIIDENLDNMDLNTNEEIAEFLEKSGLRQSALLLKNWGELDQPAVDLLAKASPSEKKKLYEQASAMLHANKNKPSQHPQVKYVPPKPSIEERAAAKKPGAVHTPGVEGNHPKPSRPGSFDGETVVHNHMPSKPGKTVAYEDKESGATKFGRAPAKPTKVHWTWKNKDWHKTKVE